MKMSQTRDRHEFKPLLVELEERPASPLARWLFWILAVFLLVAGAWLYLGKVDVVVSGEGKVIPFGEIKVVQPVNSGVIKKILIKEGAHVSKGEPLMEIDPSVTQSSLISKEKNAALLRMEIDRLEALISSKPFDASSYAGTYLSAVKMQKRLYDATREAHEKKIRQIKEQLRQSEEQYQAYRAEIGRLEQLLALALEREKRLKKVLDLVAGKEYDALKKSIVEYREEIGIKKHELRGLLAKKRELTERISMERKAYRRQLLEELTRKKKESAALQAEIESVRYQNAKQIITSPVEGHIGKLLVHTDGGVVTPAQNLMTIVPIHTPLVFKVLVSNSEIGFIKKDMNASVKIKTYNFQKYGLVRGKVIHVSDDAVEDKKLGSVYEVFIRPEKEYLSLDGKRYFIRPGMGVTAEMKVGKRRVINFFIYPLIRYLDEGLSVR
jgi:hemolysin D